MYPSIQHCNLYPYDWRPLLRFTGLLLATISLADHSLSAVVFFHATHACHYHHTKIHCQPRGGNLPCFWVRTCGWSPRTHPIHIPGISSEKNQTHLSKKDTPLIYFWIENDTYSYTWRLKTYTPFQPHVTPPPPLCCQPEPNLIYLKLHCHHAYYTDRWSTKYYAFHYSLFVYV